MIKLETQIAYEVRKYGRFKVFIKAYYVTQFYSILNKLFQDESELS